MDQGIDGPILLLGEGDFSFSVAYRKKLPQCNITSSCLLTQTQLHETHKSAEENINILESLGVVVNYEVDATKLGEGKSVGHRKFKRIIFNFPHTGGKSNIKNNRALLKNFFASVGDILEPRGVVYVTLCQGQAGTPMDKPLRKWLDSWQVVGMATFSDFILTSIRPFQASDFVEYSCTGFRSLDKHFYVEGSLTHAFQHHASPSVKPTAIELTPGHITDTQGTSYTTSSYIAKRFNRQLLKDEMHPVSRILRKLRAELSKSIDIKEISSEPFLDKNEGCTPLAFEYEILGESVGSGNQKRLRTTVLENLIGCEAGDSQVLVSGDVYRQPSEYDMHDLPVQHELAGLMKCGTDSDLSELKETLSNAIDRAMGDTSKQVLLTRATDIPVMYRDHFDMGANMHAIEITYVSSTSFTTNSCNQVIPVGTPDPERNLSKATKLSKEVGYIGKRKGGNGWLFVVILDHITTVTYDMPDSRVLWSENPTFVSNYSSTSGDEPYNFEPLGIFPPLWRHDLSFWDNDNEEFDEQCLQSVIREVAGDVLQSVICRSVWAEPQKGRISRCYRQVYQSYDVPISHAKAHDFQNCIRLTVAKEMGLTLR